MPWVEKKDLRIEILLTELITIIHRSLAADGITIPIEDIIEVQPSKDAGIWELVLKTKDGR